MNRHDKIWYFYYCELSDNLPSILIHPTIAIDQEVRDRFFIDDFYLCVQEDIEREFES